jgi:hypothetical protein
MRVSKGVSEADGTLTPLAGALRTRKGETS